ncbi:uncharacterized protein LOC129738360 [Uranotaenia lowii]|uniref:uncharacterized protein LOC129738360 n=1 Tax=Uranotaenia lowii TaxID=190385 RepID=UPI002478F139|nr:uncharacterized protein LOC129738360 [Uranotaenia lowii]
MDGSQRPTKRQVSGCVMSFFDPHGHLAPFTIHGKLIIQDLWRENCGWDEVISDQIAAKWERWIKALPEVEALKIPRCYFSFVSPQDRESIQLHIFSDASENAYGSAAYFRININGQVHCAIVAAKAKVARLQHLSIPRLELLAAVLGARLAQWILANHNLCNLRIFFWTDSLTVLSWIVSDHRNYKQFVAFRIGEIHSLTNINDWRWVPTKLNIADILTKWGNGPQLSSNEQWVNGPNFLYLPEEQWPQREKPTPNVAEELKAIHNFHDIILPEPLIDCTRFSRWLVMVRTIGCLFRFASNCRRKKEGQPIQVVPCPETSKLRKLVMKPLECTVVPLTQEEHRRAEGVLGAMAQSKGFGDELKILTKNRDVPPEKWIAIERDSPLHKKSLLLDENRIIRLEGRSAYTDLLPFEMRFPIVLPREHDVTSMLLQFYHKQFGHANCETLVNEVRQQFYVPHLRAAVKQIEKNCGWCKIKKCLPRQPKMGPLPDQRLTPGLRPFSFVGIDYFGPILVTVGRRLEKRWVALMTCLTTRAVHMEVVHSLSSQSCIMAIERFTGIRGTPLEFFSDNGTNFQAVSKEYGKLGLQIDTACADRFTRARTRWNFNPPSAPHMGGIWERLVRSTKEAMKALDDGRRLTDEVLLTVLAKAAEMINCRPLTYIPQESSEVEALTPNHFIRGFPSGEHHQVEETANPAEALRDQYKRALQLADILWQPNR